MVVCFQQHCGQILDECRFKIIKGPFEQVGLVVVHNFETISPVNPRLKSIFSIRQFPSLVYHVFQDESTCYFNKNLNITAYWRSLFSLQNAAVRG